MKGLTVWLNTLSQILQEFGDAWSCWQNLKDGKNSSMTHISANLEPCLTLPSALEL